MNVLGICAGIGGIELGLHVATNGSANPVCFIERDRFCQRILQTRFPGTPIWDDVTTFDAAEWAGKIDCITAGFPCQPWSVAGKRKGTEDDRWLWPAIKDILRKIRPRFAFLENVPGLLVGGLGNVLADLAELGFDAGWGVFSCAELGASHLRKRVFILADSGCIRLQAHSQQYPRVELVPAWSSDRGLGIWAPGPGSNKWQNIPKTIWPVEYKISGVADGISRRLDPDRKNRLKALGNAVSPPVAAYAWRVLTERMDSR